MLISWEAGTNLGVGLAEQGLAVGVVGNPGAQTEAKRTLGLSDERDAGRIRNGEDEALDEVEEGEASRDDQGDTERARQAGEVIEQYRRHCEGEGVRGNGPEGLDQVGDS